MQPFGLMTRRMTSCISAEARSVRDTTVPEQRFSAIMTAWTDKRKYNVYIGLQFK